MLPSLFLSHGSPMTPLLDIPARHFLAGLGATLARPRAILVASAHWETPAPEVNAVAVNDTIHDFYGFPRPLYELRYPAPGDKALAQRVLALLGASGLKGTIDHERGLDHGAWVPLLLAYPEADIPVVQLSLQAHRGPAYHLALGRAIAALRAEGVLVIGSGSWTHDLRRGGRGAIDAPDTPDVVAFCDWMNAALLEGRTADLLDYRKLAPHGAEQHPTEEHLLPLFVAMGAAMGKADVAKAERIHASGTYGFLRMDSYAFH